MNEENSGKMVLKKEDLQKMDNGEFTEEDYLYRSEKDNLCKHLEEVEEWRKR